MRVNGSIKVKYGMTVGDLKRQLREDGVPDHATIDLYIDAPDRPGESGVKEIKVSWQTAANS